MESYPEFLTNSAYAPSQNEEFFPASRFTTFLDKRFGTDEALGVVLRLEGTDLLFTDAELLRRYGGPPEGWSLESLLPGGGSAVCCTEYAMLIQRVLSGSHTTVIVGFANEANPVARVVHEQLHPGGHDFAIVANRYLVDPWIRLVACACDQIVYDLDNPLDAAKALDWYGPSNNWELLPVDNNLAFPRLPEIWLSLC